MYKLVNKIDNGDIDLVIKLSERKFIPFDPGNADYQEYLKWLAEGNEPEPADEE